MRCSRVHTPYVHLLATSVWYTDLSCRWGSWKTLQKGPEMAFLAVFHTFWRTLAYLAALTIAPATQMSCNWVHTPYVHLLAAFAWYADPYCSCGTWKTLNKRAKNGILAVFHTFWRALAYLAPITSAPATQMSSTRVHTPYVHLLATFAWYADLACRCRSWKVPQKGPKTAFWLFFTLFGGL